MNSKFLSSCRYGNDVIGKGAAEGDKEFFFLAEKFFQVVLQLVPLVPAGVRVDPVEAQHRNGNPFL